MKKKISKNLRKFRKFIIEYILTSRLFITYVILSLIGMCLVRYFTLGDFITLRSFIANTGIIIIIGSFGYLVKAKRRFNYLFVWMIVFCALQIVNTIYYKFYTSFASFGDLATAGQTETVADSIFDRVSALDIMFIIFPIIFYVIHRKLSKSTYYNFIEKIEKTKKMVLSTFLVGLGMIVFILATSTPTDYSRLAKQWNRNLNVERFGIMFYQVNDLIQTLTPRFTSLFGYEEAAEKFNEYYENLPAKEPNEYTGIMEGKNVIFVHMESIQTFLLDMSFNGEDVLPYTKQLIDEGMYFSNFYPQISTGTSSDSEFSLLSGLYPAASGTVFVSYYDRYYETLPKILGAEGYTSFSMHGNNFSMWNRSYAHPSLGYQEFYYKTEYDFTDEDVVGLGINDSLFFSQSFEHLKNIENNNESYMGTIITLSNHSPFEDVSRYAEYDLSTTITEEDENGNLVETVVDPLSEESIGRYIKSAHFADQALGEFMEMVRTSENFNDTVFVFYGDHDAKFSRNDLAELINYNQETGIFTEEDEEGYIEYDSFDHEVNKKTPLIIWTKNEELRKELQGEITYPMGMIDISPTILNMMNLENSYALGNDIFEYKENNHVIFPNASFITEQIYYNNSTGDYKILKEGTILTDDYISNLIKIAEEELDISNSIIVHDLILKEGLRKGTDEEEE